MPLPGGAIPLALGERNVPPSYLVRFPEDTWTKLAAAAAQGGVSVTIDDGFTLNLPGQDPIPLDTHGTGQASELFAYDRELLVPVGAASARLSVPFTIGATSRAAEKVRQQSEALDRERQARAERVTGKPATASSTHSKPVEASNFRPSPIPSRALGMSRTQSGPAAANLSVERVPLKTLVVQLLALGPATLDEIVEGTAGEVSDVSRMVNVIAQQIPDSPGKYTLRPQQYAKIKIGGWDRYSYEDKVHVVALARKAFDELGLAPDAEERQELDKKESEALAEGPPQIPSQPEPSRNPSPVKRSSISPVKRTSTSPVKQGAVETSRAASPAGNGAKKPAKDKTERTKLGKQIAKMRNDHIKRTSSLPNTKTDGGTASPRVGSPKVLPEEDPKPAKPAATKKDEAKKRQPSPTGSVKRKRTGERRGSARNYTSSDDSSDGERGRRRAPKATNASVNGGGKAAATATTAGSSKRRTSPVYTSSDDDKRSKQKRKRDNPETQERLLPSFKRRPSSDDDKRKIPNANGHRETTPRTPSAPDAKELRRRYEELFPRYERLASTLAGLYQTAERVRDGDGSPGPLPSESDLAVKVAQWEEWHRELEGIRAWFAA